MGKNYILIPFILKATVYWDGNPLTSQKVQISTELQTKICFFFSFFQSKTTICSLMVNFSIFLADEVRDLTRGTEILADVCCSSGFGYW